MAFDAFLKIDGIPGESSDDKHKDWIEITSFSIGASQPASAVVSSAGGASHERVNCMDLSITKILDKATPLIAQACWSGKAVGSVVLELNRAAGDNKVKYMEYKLSECIISSITNSGAGGSEIQESVSFNYGKIEMTYTQQKRSDGSGGGNVPSGWDLTKNKKV